MSDAALRSNPQHSSAPLALLPDRERDIANMHAYQLGHPHHQITLLVPHGPHLPSSDTLIVATVTIVALMVQLLITNLNATARAILSLGITFELLGLLLIISIPFPQRFRDINPPMAPRTPVYFATGAPTVLILMGIFGLSAAIIVETVKFSLSVAMAMSCILIIAGMLCLLASLLRACGRL